MNFYEILEQVIALLQRHGRLSYRALTVQFALDDDRLDLLKEELIDIQHGLLLDSRVLCSPGRLRRSMDLSGSLKHYDFQEDAGHKIWVI